MQKLVDRPLAIVDVETTGLSPKWDRIIEICILRVERGEIVDKLDTLINPQTHISPFIEQITGISKDEIENAPLFLERQERIVELLEGAIFIAHNVNFDYSFIREELKRLDHHYSAKTLCTVRLSRRLYPEHRSHSLSAIIERYGYSCIRRHRAYDDAFVLHQFLTDMKKSVPKKQFEELLQLTMKNFYSSDERLQANVDDLPETPGVYIFYDKENIPLYVGKSVNIKERVKSHLTPTVGSTSELSIMNDLSRIEYIKTAGELGALLIESEKIKELQPIYNRKLRKNKKYLTLQKTTDPAGYLSFESHIIETFEGIDFDLLFGVFKSKKSIKETISHLAQKYFLCPKILGIENTKSSCFEYKLGRCRGACIGKESVQSHNARFLIAYLENKQFRPWMFDGPIEVVEKDEQEGIYESFLIDKWCLLGKRTGEYDFSLNQEVPFDLDSYKIIASYLKYKKANIRKVDMSDLTLQ